MKYSPKDLYLAQREFKDQIKKIPKKNKQKFSVDLIKLVQHAQKDDYENFNFE